MSNLTLTFSFVFFSIDKGFLTIRSFPTKICLILLHPTKWVFTTTRTINVVNNYFPQKNSIQMYGKRIKLVSKCNEKDDLLRDFEIDLLKSPS